MKLILLIASYLILVQAVPKERHINCELKKEWELYKFQFQKYYDPINEPIRRSIWEENLKHIRQHNLEYDLGKHSFTLGINEFSDMTHEEFKEIYLENEIRHHHNLTKVVSTSKNKVSLPDYIDWRKRGFVAPVQNQGTCNCGYAFASVGALEGQNFNRTGELLGLSKQQIVDCSTSYGNVACSGGVVSKSLSYIADYGVELEEDYIFQGANGTCKYDKSKVQVTSKGFRYVSSGRENDLAEAVAYVGPIAVSIDASQPSFKSYQSGIYDDPACSTTALNHAVLVVGYGVEDGKYFWLAKNSWGGKWGVRGYIKISKDNNNQCGIASRAAVPLV